MTAAWDGRWGDGATRAGSRVAGGAAAGDRRTGSRDHGVEISGAEARKRAPRRSRRGLRTRRRKASNGGGDVGPWSEPGHDLLDLELRLAAGGAEHLGVVVGSQVRREEPGRRQMQRCRPRACRARRESAAPCERLRCGCRPRPRTCRAHRGNRRRGMDSPRGGARRGCPAPPGGRRRSRSHHAHASRNSEAGDERRIGEATEGNEDVVLHAGVVAPALDTLSRRPRASTVKRVRGRTRRESIVAHECDSAERSRARDAIHCGLRYLATRVWPNRGRNSRRQKKVRSARSRRP